ncbi:Mycobacterium rhizamassiliense ORFan [Mycobacterium rhizamassiliense]|uniref:Mycobacterium rhizamassiliense ORFan n=1 Tax=Mycobacterium rhizamassiliense TaxID=1841860 RepID=A0A2U3NQD6_9MYCO|nr:Mycobacterium rhizamassiliense ORFan [Mycobacterium rhizamassiliense]
MTRLAILDAQGGLHRRIDDWERSWSISIGTLEPLNGATVVVNLRNQANVQVMTSSEYRNYKSGGRYRYLGGT